VCRRLQVALVTLLMASGWAVPGEATGDRLAARSQGTAAAGSSTGERADLEKARRLIAAGAAQEAANLLERSVAAAPKDADALLLLGTARALLAQRTLSLDALRRAVALEPDSAPGHYALCMALARFGEIEAARSSCEAAVEADAGLVDAHITLGTLLASQEKLVEADEHFTRALAADTEPATRAHASLLRGRLRRQRGLTAEAIRDFEEAVRLRSDSAPAHLELARARIDVSEDAGAIAALRRAVELDPDSFDAQHLLGSQYLRGGDAERAVAHLRRALGLRPEDRDVVYGLGRALRATGATGEATELLRGLSRQSRDRAIRDADVREAGRLNNEGIELEGKGDYEAALARYRAAVEIHPQDPRFRKNVGLVLCRLRRWVEAKVELREVLRTTPGEPDALKALYLALEHAPDADANGRPD
jgi:tetratricopeptide (TPR) repeat protein